MHLLIYKWMNCLEFPQFKYWKSYARHKRSILLKGNNLTIINNVHVGTILFYMYGWVRIDKNTTIDIVTLMYFINTSKLLYLNYLYLSIF